MCAVVILVSPCFKDFLLMMKIWERVADFRAVSWKTSLVGFVVD